LNTEEHLAAAVGAFLMCALRRIRLPGNGTYESSVILAEIRRLREYEAETRSGREGSTKSIMSNSLRSEIMARFSTVISAKEH
jgi:hypothetical protein